MARPRTPTAVLEARGGLIGRKQRREARANEPVPNGPLGYAPKYFTDEEKSAWNELKRIAPEGVLAKLDRWAVENACQLMAKVRARTILVGERAQLTTLLSKMGMTPADRSKVSATLQAAPADEWDELDAPNSPVM